MLMLSGYHGQQSIWVRSMSLLNWYTFPQLPFQTYTHLVDYRIVKKQSGDSFNCSLIQLFWTQDIPMCGCCSSFSVLFP